MELRHLEYFVAVAEEENFTRAAARLHVVQSAVSATVKALERELGVPLLDRNSKRVLMTDAGAELLIRARTVLDAARDARDAVDEVGAGLRGTLRIGTMTSIKLLDMPALLGEYHRRYPGVHVQTRAAPSGSQGMVDALTDRRLDLAFVSRPGPSPAGIAIRDLAYSVLDLVIPAGHPLAGQRTVTLQDLAGLDFIDSPEGYGNRTVADRAFEAAGLHRNVSVEITDIATGVDYVRHGLGVSLLPRFIFSDVTGVQVKTVTGADLAWPLSVATSSDRAPSMAARGLIGLVEEFLEWPKAGQPAAGGLLPRAEDGVGEPVVP
jgi:DNA-binding transcriptional LysR family regulator